MRIKPLLLFIAMISSCAFISCNEEISYPSKDKEQNKIQALITDFYKRIHPETRTGEARLKIRYISSTSYGLNHPSENSTRTSETPDSFQLHTVSVDFDRSTGYVILSDTPGIEQVFYYTENGCLSDTAIIAPLKEMIEYFPTMAENMLMDIEQTNVPMTRADSQIGPIVRFMWHQRYPYNYNGSYCNCSKCTEKENHKPIGCAAVAVGQTIATVKKFRGTFYGNYFIDFDSFPDYFIKGYHSSSTALQIAHFMQEIALNCQTKFTCDGSSASIYAVNNYLHDLGYDSNLEKGELNIERFQQNLQKGHPHIISGTGSSGGHLWVADGIRQRNGETHIHINWGHGYEMSMGWCIGNYYLDSYKNFEYNKSHAQLYID